MTVGQACKPFLCVIVYKQFDSDYRMSISYLNIYSSECNK